MHVVPQSKLSVAFSSKYHILSLVIGFAESSLDILWKKACVCLGFNSSLVVILYPVCRSSIVN